jgi:type I restriction enzyme S subunit
MNRDYLGYFLRSEMGQGAISSMTVGSTQPKLALFRIEQIEVPCPALGIQESIVSVLNALDDRITLLRETNTTLEAIAQALFKSWFVDFDPVHAKMQGRAPEGMDQATAALFPDSLEESELGDVPKGWRVGIISDLGEVICGKTPPTSNRKNYGDDVPAQDLINPPAFSDLAIAPTAMAELRPKQKIIDLFKGSSIIN